MSSFRHSSATASTDGRVQHLRSIMPSKIVASSPLRQVVTLDRAMVAVVAVFAVALLVHRTPESAERAVVEKAAAAVPPPETSTEHGVSRDFENARVKIGREIFFDESLSVPEGTSCASCHDPAQGYSGTHGSPIGVARGSAPGKFARRSTPSVLYMRFVPRFHLRWDDESEFPEAFGGFFWDGRADSIAAVAPQPLLNTNEMGNPDLATLARKLEASRCASELRAEFDGVFDSPEKTVQALAYSIEAFLISAAMSPFTSKYDESLRGNETLTSLEAEGLALFSDRTKAGCVACHKFDGASRLPEASLFTDFGYDTVSVPHNRDLPAASGRSHFDLGLCERKDRRLHTDDEWFCGSFRTPSLRNVAKRKAYMHNGVFSNLRDVVTFYATRATDPKRWYGKDPFDDLPKQYRKYVNTSTPPYDGLEGGPPALSDHEVDAIVAFLGTLSDREVPGAP